jgi:hypothetical protein
MQRRLASLERRDRDGIYILRRDDIYEGSVPDKALYASEHSLN